MIYLGSDHGGFDLKEKIKKWLTQWGYKSEDLGAFTHDPEDDYPVYAFAVAEKVGREDDTKKSWKERSKGILICRSAGGVIIAANKVRHVKAVAAFSQIQAKHAREHNDANIIGISGSWTEEKEVEKIVKAFVETEFSKENRHARRIEQITDYETEDYTGAGCKCGGDCGC